MELTPAEGGVDPRPAQPRRGVARQHHHRGGPAHPGRLVGTERPAVPHRRLHPLLRYDDGDARALQVQSLGIGRARHPGHRTAGSGDMDHAVARVEPAEPAGAGVEPLLQGLVEHPGPGRPAMADGDDLGVGGGDGEGPGHRVRDQLHRAVDRLARIADRDDHDLLAGGLDLEQLTDADTGDQLADRPGVRRTGDDLRARPRGQHIGEDPPGTRRAQHAGVTAQHQPGAVRQRLDEDGGALHVQLGGVQHHEQVQRERPVLVPAGALGAGEQPGQGDGRSRAPARRPAGGGRPRCGWPQGPPQAPRRRDQGGGLGPGRLAAVARPVRRRPPYGSARRPRGTGRRLQPRPSRPPSPGYDHGGPPPVGEALLGQRVAVQATT
ncbi:hypothetical protein SMICM304S_08913 [Streptomyces microflavus]